MQMCVCICVICKIKFHLVLIARLELCDFGSVS